MELLCAHARYTPLLLVVAPAKREHADAAGPVSNVEFVFGASQPMKHIKQTLAGVSVNRQIGRQMELLLLLLCTREAHAVAVRRRRTPASRRAHANAEKAQSQILSLCSMLTSNSKFVGR